MIVWQSVANIAGSLVFISLTSENKIGFEYSGFIIFTIIFWKSCDIIDAIY